jgi:hypothetical protein
MLDLFEERVGIIKKCEETYRGPLEFWADILEGGVKGGVI